MSHTQGKLEVFFDEFDDTWPGIDSMSGQTIVIFAATKEDEAGVRGKTKDEAKANARRLVACWNACDGISTEELEADAIRKLREQRDELLAALQDVLRAHKERLPATVMEAEAELDRIRAAAAKARAAIAKAESNQ